MVGIAATMRYDIEFRSEGDGYLQVRHTAGLVTLAPSKGTLKSTRMRTRFPLSSRSVMDNLFERDMITLLKQAAYPGSELYLRLLI